MLLSMKSSEQCAKNRFKKFIFSLSTISFNLELLLLLEVRKKIVDS